MMGSLLHACISWGFHRASCWTGSPQPQFWACETAIWCCTPRQSTVATSALFELINITYIRLGQSSAELICLRQSAIACVDNMALRDWQQYEVLSTSLRQVHTNFMQWHRRHWLSGRACCSPNPPQGGRGSTNSRLWAPFQP